MRHHRAYMQGDWTGEGNLPLVRRQPDIPRRIQRQRSAAAITAVKAYCQRTNRIDNMIDVADTYPPLKLYSVPVVSCSSTLWRHRLISIETQQVR